MLRRFKIKSQIVFFTASVLGLIILLQIILYSVLQHENKSAINSIFESVAQNTVSQIKKLNDDVAELSSLLAVHNIVQSSLYEYSSPEIVQNMNNIQNLLSEYRTRNQNVAFLGLIKDHSLFMSDESTYLYNDVRNIIETLTPPKNSNAIYTPSFIYEGHVYFACITPVFPTNVSYYTPIHAGNFVVCIYEMNTVNYAPYDFIDNSQIELVITDENNRIMLSSNPNDHGTEFITKEMPSKFLCKTLPIKNPTWNVTVFMPNDNSVNLSYLSTVFIAIVIIITLVMLILMLKLLNELIIKKIVLLKEKVKRISDGDTSYRIQYDYADELSEIVAVINNVLETLHRLNNDKLKTLDNLYQTQLLQKETQIFYLHGQVSPHFLYNSLSHIQGIAFEYNAKEIVNITSSLAKVFRYFSNNLYFSTIRQDLDCAIEYFNVINLRRENPIKLINNVDDELMGIRCLKMIYQPILENVLKHAFEIDDSGVVTISSIPDDKKAIIEISDNGHGIPPDILEELKRKLEKGTLNQTQTNDHIGLINVNMRLKLCYGMDSGIYIISRENHGTTVRIIYEKSAPKEFEPSQNKT